KERNETCHIARAAEDFCASRHRTLGWWNGRHGRLRGVCRKACGFKSRPEHHSFIGLESWQVSKFSCRRNFWPRMGYLSSQEFVEFFQSIRSLMDDSVSMPRQQKGRARPANA